MEKKSTFQLVNKYRGAIMGIAALWILFFHEWIPIMEGHWKTYAVEVYIKTIGFCGVDFFLFLSGIGLVYAISKGSVFSFYKRRLQRVFIPFLVMAVILAVRQGWDGSTFFRNVFAINFYTRDIYSFLWYVPAILTLYLLFPFYYRLFEKSSNKYLFTGAVLLIWLLLSIWGDAVIREDLYGFTNRIPVFVVGILVGWIMRQREVVFSGLAWFVCIIAFITGLYLAYVTNFENYFLLVPISDCCLPNFLIAISGTFMLAKLFQVVDLHMKELGKLILRFFSFFGAISLELYCVQEYVGHFIMINMSEKYSDLLINITTIVNVAISASGLWAVCWLIRKILEQVGACLEKLSKKV